MEQTRQIIAENLIELRKVNKLTQRELAEKLNYSDKAISKWEQGESLPDVEVLCDIAKIYGVTLDYLVTKDHEKMTEQYKISVERANNNKTIVTWLSVFSVVLIYTLAYIFALIIGEHSEWILFVWMVPSCFLVLLIFNCIWGKSNKRYFLISGLMWTMLTVLTLQFMDVNRFIWLIFCLGVPGQVIIFLVAKFIHRKQM